MSTLDPLGLFDQNHLKPDDFPDLLSTPFPVDQVATRNCENLQGSVSVPVGVAGPVRVASRLFDNNEEIVIPLATTEGALVASVNRGCKAVTQAGGAHVFSKKIGMSRAPVFRCADGQQAAKFVTWLDKHISLFAKACEQTSQHLTFLSHTSYIRGRHVYVRFVFDTDQAMGMNMVSIALSRAWQQLQESETVFSQKNKGALAGVEMISLSSNVCTDKKDAAINKLLGRGYWVQAEVKLSKKILTNTLKTTVQDMVATHVAKNLVGSNVAGSLSQNMHAANSIAALFIATGQDPAHVTEVGQVSTTFEVVKSKSRKTSDELYAAVTLPDVPVGVVGGGTWLPAQTQARNLIRVAGSGKPLTAQQLAEVVGVAVLAGEVSGLAALAGSQLAAAHHRLGRG